MLHEKLQRVEARYREIEGEIARPEILADQETYQKLLKELSSLKDTVDQFHALKQVEKEKADLQGLLRDNADEEMKGLIEADLTQANEQEAALKLALEGLLLPKDPYEDKNIFLEIRAGTGGEEAALFAGDLLRMYLRYAENQGWKVEIAEENSTGLGGYKEVIVEITGKSVYGKMKYESGTHRVQRVPATEASGRIHTSAVTVAVLPEVADIDLNIEDKDLRIDVYRSSGPGGQNVNKTSSAVRITHLPTGTVVACQNERSQHQNKYKAMQLLRSRILDEMEKRQKKELADSRKILVGSGDRSEKIRTYNYPQGRVTDHRIGLTIYNLEHILDGNIDDLINALIAADRLAKIAKIK